MDTPAARLSDLLFGKACCSGTLCVQLAGLLLGACFKYLYTMHAWPIAAWVSLHCDAVRRRPVLNFLKHCAQLFTILTQSLPLKMNILLNNCSAVILLFVSVINHSARSYENLSLSTLTSPSYWCQLWLLRRRFRLVCEQFQGRMNKHKFAVFGRHSSQRY